MDIEKLESLRDRLEKATGPDRELDKELSKVLLGEPSLSPLTGSLDAAISLVERLLPDWEWMAKKRDTPLGKNTGEGYVNNGKLFMSGERKQGCEFAHTPVLALCAAILSALIEIENAKENRK